MLPPAGPSDGEFAARQEVVLSCTSVLIGRQQRPAFKIPFARNTGAAVRMTRADAKCHAARYVDANVSALQRIAVVIVDAFAFGIELIGKQVVIEAPASA